MDEGNANSFQVYQATIACFFVYPNCYSFGSCTVFALEEIRGPARVQTAQSAVRVVIQGHQTRGDGSTKQRK